MRFSDIIGQKSAIDSLRQAIDTDRLPHALLLSGDEGFGGLALAWATARYIMCEHRKDGEACGKCASCIQADKLIHPDLHFVYPVVNKASGTKSSTSEDYLPQWREALVSNPYLTLTEWTTSSAEANKQAQIFVTEAASIIHHLSTKPFSSDYRIMIIWLPEKMKEDAANKLLKIIEEPYEKTHFLLVTSQPDQIIGTIRSRSQRLNLQPIDEADLARALTERFQATEKQARDAARMSHGSFTEAVRLLRDDENGKFFFEKFCAMMRLSYARRLFDMKAWSDEMAALTREEQKSFLQYAQRLIRENFIMNFAVPELNYMTENERQFSERFSLYVNHNNVEGIMNELAMAENDILHNANSKMVFFDLSLKMIMLLKNAGNT